MNAEAKLAQITELTKNVSIAGDQLREKVNAILTGVSENHVEARNGSTAANGIGEDLSAQEKLAIITSNLQETLDQEIMEDVLMKQNRPLSIYWGTATTGRPHCAYFVPMLKISEFLRAGCRVKILLADIHGFMDNLKAPIELVKWRAQYYKFIITELLKAVNVPIDRLEFVLGSSYQLSEHYAMDLLRLTTMVTMHDAKKAGAEVVKQVEDATLSGLLYPLMQALDEEYLGVDVQFGGVDQRKIFTLAKAVLPKAGYRERAHLMNPMVPGLTGGKMSASDPDSKIDVLDKPEDVARKIKRCPAAPKDDDNGLTAFVQYVLLPASKLQTGKPRFVVERRNGEALTYETIEKLREDYRADILSPQDLKPAVAKALNELLASVQTAFQGSPEWQECEQKAYPPAAVVEKKKKVKNLGTRNPRLAAQAHADGSVTGPGSAQLEVSSNASSAKQELAEEQAKVQSHG